MKEIKNDRITRDTVVNQKIVSYKSYWNYLKDQFNLRLN